MEKKVLLLIGKPIGIDVANFLSKFSNLDLEIWSSNKELLIKKKVKFLKDKKKFINYFLRSKKNYDFLILVYWPWLVPGNLFGKFKNSLNFHPAYLPFGRGWYPHVHTLIKKFKWGVSLHKILPGMDDGDIWVQKEIKFHKFSNAKDLYDKSKDEILKLFKKNVIKIINGKVKAKKQKGRVITFFKKDLLKYDQLKLNKNYKLEDLIKISNARSFGKKTFNYFYYKKKKYSFNLEIKKISN